MYLCAERQEIWNNDHEDMYLHTTTQHTYIHTLTCTHTQTTHTHTHNTHTCKHTHTHIHTHMHTHTHTRVFSSHSSPHRRDDRIQLMERGVKEEVDTIQAGLNFHNSGNHSKHAFLAQTPPSSTCNLQMWTGSSPAVRSKSCSS